jgi:ribose transport system ATP-binding protein
MLSLEHISKSFPGVRALSDLSISFRSGEIHGLIGENGAGKSTAIKIMTGIHQPDSGRILLDGQPVRLASYRDSLARGIGIVHQELQVIPDASIAENIMIDKFITRRPGVVDWNAVRAEACKHMKAVGLAEDPDRLVRELSAAQKQLVQIAKALSANVRFLLLDEPTSSLTEHEVERLFGLLRELARKGVALLFVSHKMDEMYALCDCVSVLRDGCLVGTHPIGAIAPNELVRLMIGRECSDEHLGMLSPDPSSEVLRVEDLVRAGKAEHLNFTLHRGEILGFYGLVGSGRTELARILIGEDHPDSGHIWVKGRDTAIRSVSDALYSHSIGYVSENRKDEGLLLEDDISTNLTMTIWPRIRSRFTRRIDAGAERQAAAHYVEAMNIKTPGLTQRVGNLSGGNQQKVSIGKWLAADCEILIIDEPTVGVDVGAKQQIHQLIWDLAGKQGKSIILISSDLPELVRIASRILVFRDHRIVGEVRDVDTQRKSYRQVGEEIAPCFH